MRKPYYLFNPGRLERQDNTLKFTPRDEEGREGQPRFLPIEGVDALYVFGALDANSALYNFLGKAQISVHFFDWYEHYTGSFMPKDYLLAGKVQVEQVRAYSSKARRLVLAQQLVEGAAANMQRVLGYYGNRGISALSPILADIGRLAEGIGSAADVAALMGIEGNIRQAYYGGFDHVLKDFEMGLRSKRPPRNEVNALISFGNMMCYTACLDQIYHTQLNPTVSFLHEPGFRRYSLALDISEIFKPILVDRLIFSMLNKREIQDSDFRYDLNRCVLKESAGKKFAKAWDERLKETIQHRVLKKSVSYKTLIRLECYKIQKYIVEGIPYKPFKMWW
ncbi:MAG TPA: type I-B CRISPR-associated endonuclease Cas1b [Saprospiraceae bacterium]|nr:type I-B CRISPR-associated endonuclease Cas1b [Saprospiraceae bacterium]